MALSILKIKRNSNEGLLDGKKNIPIIDLIESISFEPIKFNILGFYDLCIIGQEELLNSIFYVEPARRKTLDSMDISHSS